jgi:hypothetical protein
MPDESLPEDAIADPHTIGVGIGQDLVMDLSALIVEFMETRVAPVAVLVAEEGGDPAQLVTSMAGLLRAIADGMESTVDQP